MPRSSPRAQAAAERGTALRGTLEAAADWYAERLQAPEGREAENFEFFTPRASPKSPISVDFAPLN